MAGEKFLKYSGGIAEEVEAVQTGGGGSANKIPSLDNTGKLDATMLPTGLGGDLASMTASESLTAGDFVNVWDSSGPKIRKADASDPAKPAHGFVLDNISSNSSGTVYFEGTNNQVSAMTPGTVYLSTTPGAASATPPSGSGDIVQRVGVAISATEINFEMGSVIKLA